MHVVHKFKQNYASTFSEMKPLITSSSTASHFQAYASLASSHMAGHMTPRTCLAGCTSCQNMTHATHPYHHQQQLLAEKLYGPYARPPYLPGG